MRKSMREAQLKEEQKHILSERATRGDQLIEAWSKRPDVGKGLQDIAGNDIWKARNTAIMLENEERHLTRLTETQISTTFSTTPENVIRIVRLGYPNSIRGDVFLEWAMETARDSIYYLSPVYGKTKRDATAANVTHESPSWRYASEKEVDTLGTGDDSTVAFTGPTSDRLANPPLVPFTVTIYVNNVPVGTDDGAGGIIGTTITAASSSINYTTGAITVTFATAPATGLAIQAEYSYQSEDSDQYPDLGSVELQLRDYQFRARPFPLWASWSKMTELLLDTTLGIDAEDALVRGAADELKKSLDFWALRMGYQHAGKNSSVSFDKKQATGESEIDRAQAVTLSIDEAGDTMYNSIMRGGVTKLYGNPAAIRYLRLHRRFRDDGAQPAVGAYKVGSLDGIDVYKVPTSIVPDPNGEGQMVAVYRNREVPEDVSIAFGSLVPLYQTQTLEFKEQYSETGLSFYGDAKVLRSEYLVRIVLSDTTA